MEAFVKRKIRAMSGQAPRWTALLLLFPAPVISQTITWETTNGPPDVSINVFLVHSGLVFTGTADDYVYRSSDDGITWEQVSDGFLTQSITDLASGPQGAVLACGYGVYRSTDLGQQWEFLGPDDAVMSVVATSAGDLFGGAWSSVYRSTDDGLTWEPLANGLPVAWVEYLFADSAGNLYAGTTFGVLKSTDNGDSWFSIGPPGAPGSGFNLSGMDMNEEGWITVSGSTEGMYVTTDDGATWEYLFGLDSMLTAVSFESDEGYLTGNASGAVYRSTDLGLSWTLINEGFWFSGISAFGFDTGGSLLVGTSIGGMFHTSDHGGLWTQRNAGYDRATVYKLDTDSRGDLFARTRTYLYRSTDQGDLWMPTNFGDDAEGNFAIDRDDDIFASTSFLPGSRSTDHGATWTTISNGICCYIANFGFDGDGNIYAAASGFHRSTDNGDSWEVISTLIGLQTFVFTSAGTLVGGTIFGGIYRSTDGGFSWDSSGVGTPWRAFTTVAVDPGDHAFLGSQDGGGLYRSTDQGNSWERLTSGLTDSVIRSVGSNMEGMLFTATGSDGVFSSADGGNEWQPVNNGLPDTTMYDLAVDANGYLYAGGEEGVYRTTGPTTGITGDPALPHEVRLAQNYPNPFNPATTIEYGIGRRGSVALKVYNVLGEEVATLVRGVQNPGIYSVDWDASGYASGVYFYRLVVDGAVRAGKMVLTR
jgi:photosystem II stability/assembly factor-like uncharacterized protein